MRFFSQTAFRTRFALLLVALFSMMLLSGCGSSEQADKKEEKSAEKPASERVAVLKYEFDQLEKQLDIQEKNISNTREQLRAIKQRLVRGNLKGYSIDTATTSAEIQKAIEKRTGKKNKDIQEEKAEKNKKESENSFLNSLLILLVIGFLAVILIVALKDRKPASPYDVAEPYHPTPPPGEEPETENTYHQLQPRPDEHSHEGDGEHHQ